MGLPQSGLLSPLWVISFAVFVVFGHYYAIALAFKNLRYLDNFLPLINYLIPVWLTDGQLRFTRLLYVIRRLQSSSYHLLNTRSRKSAFSFFSPWTILFMNYHHGSYVFVHNASFVVFFVFVASLVVLFPVNYFFSGIVLKCYRMFWKAPKEMICWLGKVLYILEKDRPGLKLFGNVSNISPILSAARCSVL